MTSQPLTRVTRTIAGRQVTAVCAPSQEAMARDVLATLARLARSDAPRDGMRVRFGWSVLTLRDAEDGGLIVCEPDFDGDPLRDTRPQLVTTLDVLAGQTAFARQVGVVPEDIGFEQFVVVGRGALAANALHLFRDTPSAEDDSGWSITAAIAPPPPDSADDFDATYVYQFLRLRPAVLPVLILPTGFAVMLDGDRITAVIDADGRDRLIDGWPKAARERTEQA
jgi:hypothetical protein